MKFTIVALNDNLTELIKSEVITTNITFKTDDNSFVVDVSKIGYTPIGIICWNTSHPQFLYGCGYTINGNTASIYITSTYPNSFDGFYSCRVLYIKDI